MSAKSRELNKLYLSEMLENDNHGTVMYKIQKYWWPHFVESYVARGCNQTLNALDKSMGGGRQEILDLSLVYADEQGFARGTSDHTQRANQFLKSNTGKMFERFIGLSMAYALEKIDSDYCILPFRNDMLKRLPSATPTSFNVDVTLGNQTFSTKIDSDLICFNPTDSEAEIYLVSIKSTLKDRFHNVPFWNLLRLACTGNLTPNLSAHEPEFLDRLRYVAVCSDLAAQQPDFRRADGPRNLLALDAALLDGAYVSASEATGLGEGDNHFGPSRDAPFFPLSNFFDMLSGGTKN